MFAAHNLKLLRKMRGLSQEEVALTLSIKRTTLSGYENGSAEPNFENLLKLADFYHIAIDSLIRKELKPDENHPESNNTFDLAGTSLRVIATTVDRNNQENIELVPIKARAGYTAGYADPEYIAVLPTFQLPFLSPNRKYRTFPIIGDSMPPVADGSWVTGEYLQNWNFIQNGQPYILVTADEGIVFKTVYNRIEKSGSLLLCSTNPAYEPYEIDINAVKEVWKFVHYISNELPEPNLSKEELSETVMELQREVSLLKNAIRQKKQASG